MSVPAVVADVSTAAALSLALTVNWSALSNLLPTVLVTLTVGQSTLGLIWAMKPSSIGPLLTCTTIEFEPVTQLLVKVVCEAVLSTKPGKV